jgi:hypothetical protein
LRLLTQPPPFYRVICQSRKRARERVGVAGRKKDSRFVIDDGFTHRFQIWCDDRQTRGRVLTQLHWVPVFVAVRQHTDVAPGKQRWYRVRRNGAKRGHAIP